MLLAEHSPSVTQELGLSVGYAEMRVPHNEVEPGPCGDGGGASPQQPRHTLGQDSTAFRLRWWSLPSRASSGLRTWPVSLSWLICFSIQSVRGASRLAAPLESKLMCWIFFRAPLSLYESYSSGRVSLGSGESVPAAASSTSGRNITSQYCLICSVRWVF